MGEFCFFSTTLFYRLFLVLAGVSITVITMTRTTEANQLLYDPFAPYAGIMMSQYESEIEAQGFRCRVNRVSPSYIALCSMLLPDGVISEINMTFSTHNDQLTHTTFKLRENVTLGHLSLVRGKPEINLVGELAYFYWPLSHTTAIALTDTRYTLYWLPIISVSFE